MAKGSAKKKDISLEMERIYQMAIGNQLDGRIELFIDFKKGTPDAFHFILTGELGEGRLWTSKGAQDRICKERSVKSAAKTLPPKKNARAIKSTGTPTGANGRVTMPKQVLARPTDSGKSAATDTTG